MFLEKLEVQGFKSFANKNVLTFPGMMDATKRGLTAVVGPNGSGKSNVADSVRWVLGEQSMKTLRGKKSEDVIFSGSDKKGKLGMAEVSLFLNNEDRQAPIDYSQVVVTRRIFRSGESEYLLNNSRVRLSDIQMLLAKAKFGQKTYSVIGQGTVEQFLNTSLSERKEFFDEATGVKQYQIKRDDALNKLRLSYENLQQAEMLITEIEPRLKSLTRQVSRLHKRDEVERELRELQSKYYSRIWHENNDKFKDFNNKFLELEKVKMAKDKKIEGLQKEMAEFRMKSGNENEFAAWQVALGKIQNDKDEVTRKLARIEAQMELKLESSGQFDLSFLMTKKEELKKEIEIIGEEIIDLEKKIENDKAIASELAVEKAKIDQEIIEVNQSLMKASENIGKDEIKKIKNTLAGIEKKLFGLGDEEDMELVRKLIKEIEAEVKEILALAREYAGEDASVDWGEIQTKLNELNNSKEASLNKLHDNQLRTSAHTERCRLLKEKVASLTSELEAARDKIVKRSGTVDLNGLSTEQSQLKDQAAKLDIEIKALKDKMSGLSEAEEKKRHDMFLLQQSLQELQNEINQNNNALNELRINSTRYETKLEDLEIEIRAELGGLKDIRENRLAEEINMDEFKEKILQLKKQLELIGGIDPQVEKEYNETKERFDFLTGQIDDFAKAVDSLQKIIKELDLTIKEQFDKEFKKIESKFEEYFKILFNGGSAKIIKVMEEELKEEEEAEQAAAVGENGQPTKKESAELRKIKYLQKYNATGLAGIEIQATPPGKKIKAIAMLSGGERALTAIALICAIISSNPSPFVVLDEVDAALDEANSERLAKILDDLSHKTQFIVITHNRASMRRANVLYGITMGDDGVSKLLSVKLDEVKLDG